MPTLFSHALVPVAVGLGLGRKTFPPRLLVAGALAAVLPDADVIGFRFGIAYADAWGHRGASHSIVFASMIGLLAAFGHRWLKAPPWKAFAFAGLSALSHPLLDMLTDGGLGVALGWPWSDARLFAPWRVIEVSPFARGFFSARGVEVMLSELRWIWLPALAGAGVMAWLRRRRVPCRSDASRDRTM